MATVNSPIDVRINVFSTDAPLTDAPAGMLPATRDVLVAVLTYQFDLFGHAVPAYSVLLLILVCLTLGVAQLCRRKPSGLHARVSGGSAAAASTRKLLTKLGFALPWAGMAVLALVFVNLSPISYADDNHLGLKVENDRDKIEINVEQGQAAVETFTSTVTVNSDATKGYQLYAQGDVSGTSDTQDVGFIISGGDLTESTLLSTMPTAVKASLLSVQGDVSVFTIEVAVPRTLAIGQYGVQLNFSVSAPDFPVIGSISPEAGPLSGGTDITITGVNLTDENGDTYIEVGGKVCNLKPGVQPLANRVICTTQDHAAGQVDVEVTSPHAGIIDIPGLFTYLAAPTITAISPPRVASGQVTRLTITGSNFDISGAASNIVKLHQQPTGNEYTCTVVSVGASQLTCDVPAMPAASYTGSIATAGGGPSADATLTVQDAPTVTSLSPTSGVLAGGNTLTIYGANFTNGITTVTVGGIDCTSVTFVSTSQITCEVPQGAGTSATTVDVRVSVTDVATSANTPADNYTYLLVPAISTTAGDVTVNSSTNPTSIAVSPPAVALDGQFFGATSTLAIKGTNFDNITGDGSTTTSTTVTIGSAVCTNVVVTSTTALTCTPPSNTAGNQLIVVSTSGGSSVQTVNLAYLNAPAITSITPSSGVERKQTPVVIVGANFDNITGNGTTTSVTIGAGSCTSLSVTNAASLACTTPSLAASGGALEVVVATLAGSATLTGAFTFQPAPAISSISPIAGRKAGGTVIHITGINLDLFDPVSRASDTIKVGGAACTAYANISATNIDCTAPAGTPGTRDVELDTLSSSSSLLGAFTYLDSPTLTSISPTSGPVGGNTPVTITGSHFDDVNTSASTITTTISIGAIPYTMVTTTPSAGQCKVQTATTVACVTADYSTISATGGPATVTSTTDTVAATYTSASFSFTYNLSSVSIAPNYGPTTGGTAIVITGNMGLTANSINSDATVTVGGNTCTLPVVSYSINNQSITCNTPASTGSAAGWADVVINISAAGSLVGSFTESNGFNYLAVPTIGSTSQNYGIAGDSVTIAGANFDLAADASSTPGTGTTKFMFDGEAATCSITSTTSASCTVPAHPSGSGATYVNGTPGRIAITVTTGNASMTTLTGTLSSAFDYMPAPMVTSMSPNVGPETAANKTFTIIGFGFDRESDANSTKGYGSSEVTIGGKDCAVTSIGNDGKSLSCTIDSSASNFSTGTMAVVVTTAGGLFNAQDLYTAYAAPTLTAGGISPSPTNTANISVTLTGTDFISTSLATVKVDGVSTGITVSSVSANGTNLSFTFAVAKGAGRYSITVSTPGGDSSSLTYEVLDKPEVTEVTPAAGASAGGNPVTITGKNFFSGASGNTFAVTKVVVDDGTAKTDVTAINSASAAGNNSLGSFIVTMPGHDAGGPYHIRVTTAGGESDTSTLSQFTYNESLTVTSIKQTVGGLTATYIKDADTVYVYADNICAANSPIASLSAAVTTSPGFTDSPTVGTAQCTTATSGYVPVTLPARAQSMTAVHDITLSNANGTSATGAANGQVIYPLTPTISAFTNGSYSDQVGSSAATTDVVLTGTNFRISASGYKLVKKITITDAVNNEFDVSAYDVNSDTSITQTTIPIDDGAIPWPIPITPGSATIVVETYGGESNSYDFEVLAMPTITYPRDMVKAYMWQTGSGLPDEPFYIEGTGFYADSVVTIQGEVPKQNSCSFYSDTKIAGCDINRAGATAASVETEYTLQVAHPLAGTVSTQNSIRIEQVSPVSYNFVGNSGGRTEFSCSYLKPYDFPNNSSTVYHTALVNDTRNNQVYRVRRLADGQCWMIDNLQIANAPIGFADSNVTSDYTIPAAVTAGGVSVASGQVYDPTANTFCINGSLPTTYLRIHPHSQSGCGYFYNFLAATAGWGTTTEISGESPSSVCPAGWRLPSGGENTSSDFAALNIAYGGSGFDQSYNDDILWRSRGAFSGSSAGGFNSEGFYFSATASYWSSSVYSDQLSYFAIAAETAASYPGTYFNTKSLGISVRCVKIPPPSDTLLGMQTSMNVSTPDSLVNMQQLTSAICAQAQYDSSNYGNNTIILSDTRNSQAYRVRKLPDDKCWMIDSLRLNLNGLTLTSADSNVAGSVGPINTQVTTTGKTFNGDFQTSGYLTNDGSRTNTAENMDFWAQAGPVDTSVSGPNWCSLESGNWPLGSTTGCGYYYNFYTATAGTLPAGQTLVTATGSICPAGWRMPTGGEVVGASDFSALNIAFDGTGSSQYGLTHSDPPLSQYLANGMFTLPAGGSYVNALSALGLTASLWTSSASSMAMYSFYFAYSNSSLSAAETISTLETGRPVRCVL